MKLFVLVRKDLSTIQQAVQAGHAVAEYLKHHRDTAWSNGTLVYLGVDTIARDSEIVDLELEDYNRSSTRK